MYVEVEWFNYIFIMIDIGGIELERDDIIV